MHSGPKLRGSISYFVEIRLLKPGSILVIIPSGWWYLLCSVKSADNLAFNAHLHDDENAMFSHSASQLHTQDKIL